MVDAIARVSVCHLGAFVFGAAQFVVLFQLVGDFLVLESCNIYLRIATKFLQLLFGLNSIIGGPSPSQIDQKLLILLLTHILVVFFEWNSVSVERS